MYESHFGLRQRPFRPIPDSEFYYPATSHERGLAQLVRAIEEDEGIVLLTGEPGTGKTTLGHCCLDRLGDQAASAFLTNSHFGTRTGLLQAILYDLSLPHEGKTEQELRLALTEVLLKNYEAGRRTILVMDEAQYLSPDLLEELRLLSNMEGRRGKALQVLLLALPTLEQTLDLPDLAAFKQRLSVHARLEPLGLHEAADYLVHGLRAQGGSPEAIVSDEALEVVARGTSGVPRLLNRAMHQALQLACNAGQTMVDAEAALEALSSLGLEIAENGGSADLKMQDIATADGGETAAGALEESVHVLDPQEMHAEEANEDSVPDPSRSRRLFVRPRRHA